jgi:hypothetical protein
MDWHDGPWAVVDVEEATPTQLLVYSLLALQFRNAKCSKSTKPAPTSTAFIGIVGAEYAAGTSQAGELPAKWKGKTVKSWCKPQLLVRDIMAPRNRRMYAGMQ